MRATPQVLALAALLLSASISAFVITPRSSGAGNPLIWNAFFNHTTQPLYKDNFRREILESDGLLFCALSSASSKVNALFEAGRKARLCDGISDADLAVFFAFEDFAALRDSFTAQMVKCSQYSKNDKGSKCFGDAVERVYRTILASVNRKLKTNHHCIKREMDHLVEQLDRIDLDSLVCDFSAKLSHQSSGHHHHHHGCNSSQPWQPLPPWNNGTNNNSSDPWNPWQPLPPWNNGTKNNSSDPWNPWQPFPPWNNGTNNNSSDPWNPWQPLPPWNNGTNNNSSDPLSPWQPLPPWNNGTSNNSSNPWQPLPPWNNGTNNNSSSPLNPWQPLPPLNNSTINGNSTNPSNPLPPQTNVTVVNPGNSSQSDPNPTPKPPHKVHWWDKVWSSIHEIF